MTSASVRPRPAEHLLSVFALGHHGLEVEAVLSEEAAGKVGYDFDAEGFEPDCNPNDKPAFEVGT